MRQNHSPNAIQHQNIWTRQLLQETLRRDFFLLTTLSSRLDSVVWFTHSNPVFCTEIWSFHPRFQFNVPRTTATPCKYGLTSMCRDAAKAVSKPLETFMGKKGSKRSLKCQRTHFGRLYWKTPFPAGVLKTGKWGFPADHAAFLYNGPEQLQRL